VLSVSGGRSIDAVSTEEMLRMRLCLVSVFARDSICAKRDIYAIAIPSVRLSHWRISQKRLKLGSCNFHRTVVPSL